MDREMLLEKFRLDVNVLDDTDYTWEELESIYHDYTALREELNALALVVVDFIKGLDLVHSVRFRTKDPDHLIEKIIRKNRANRDYHPTPDNYRELVTDLIGIRVLHLFKEDWVFINEFILEQWDLMDKVVANIREGDSEALVSSYKNNECDVRIHPAGYRSVHYLIKIETEDNSFIGEVQVRTIFEEAWSEIDHTIRYPYATDDEILSEYLVIFNRLVGSADEMGSFIKKLNDEMIEINDRHEVELAEKDAIIEDLSRTIAVLEIDARKKEDLEEKLKRLNG